MQQNKALANMKNDLSTSKFCGRGNQKTIELQDRVQLRVKQHGLKEEKH